jgi:hypothetical protein
MVGGIVADHPTQGSGFLSAPWRQAQAMVWVDAPRSSFAPRYLLFLPGGFDFFGVR